MAEVSVQLIYPKISADIGLGGEILHNIEVGGSGKISYTLGTDLAESAFFLGCHICPVFVTRFWDGNYHINSFYNKDA
jgi:hypothetical protein